MQTLQICQRRTAARCRLLLAKDIHIWQNGSSVSRSRFQSGYLVVAVDFTEVAVVVRCHQIVFTVECEQICTYLFTRACCDFVGHQCLFLWACFVLTTGLTSIDHFFDFSRHSRPEQASLALLKQEPTLRCDECMRCLISRRRLCGTTIL